MRKLTDGQSEHKPTYMKSAKKNQTTDSRYRTKGGRA